MNTNLAAFVSDLHFGTHHVPAWKLTRRILLDQKPSIIVLGGDCFDPTAVSHWTSSPDEKRTFMGQVKGFRAEVASIRAEHPKAKMYYLEGNHEIHLKRFINQHAPELSDFDDLQLPRLLRLDECKIEYLNERTPLDLGPLRLLHGHQLKLSFAAAYPARNLFFKQFRDVMMGHLHRIQCYRHQGDDKLIRCWLNGTLQDRRRIDYDYGPNWQLGFSLIEWDSSATFYGVEQVEIMEVDDKIYAKTFGDWYWEKNTLAGQQNG